MWRLAALVALVALVTIGCSAAYGPVASGSRTSSPSAPATVPATEAPSPMASGEPHS